MQNSHLTPPSPSGLRLASKKEKYFLKKQKKERERFRLVRRKKIRKIISGLGIIFIIGALVIGVGYFIIGLTGTSPEESQGRPKIEITPQEYDAGTVSMAEGLVKYTYEIKNTGEGDLKIDRIWTSCMCTTARLKVGDKTSGEFGMHDNPIFWSQKITPGETGFLEVAFDPAFHGPKGTGSAVRIVYLSTNDPQNKEVQARLLANVIP